MSERLPHEKGFHKLGSAAQRRRALAWRLDGKGPDNGVGKLLWRLLVEVWLQL